MKRVHNWYMNRIPTSPQQFKIFLSNAVDLGETFAPNQPLSFDGVSWADAFFPGYRDVSTSVKIPNWIYDTEAHEILLDRELSSKDAHALITALWNNAILCGTQFRNHRRLNNARFRKTDTFYDYATTLHTNETIAKSAYGTFNDIANELLYTPQSLLGALQTNDVPTALMHYLNRNLRDTIWQIFGDEIGEILEQIVDTPDDYLRKALSDRLKELLDDQQQEQGCCMPGLDQDQEQKPPCAENANAYENMCNLNRIQLSEDLQEALDKLEEVEAERAWDRLTTAKDRVVVQDVMEYRDHPRDIPPSPLFRNLGEILQQLKVPRYDPVFPEDRGTTLLEPYIANFFIDGKVLGYPEVRDQEIEKEVIICCDISGSTDGHSDHSCLWYKELCAARGAFNSLKAARDTVSVYVHTAIVQETDPLLIKVVDQESVNINSRFRRVRTISNDNNYEQWIIDYLTRNGYHSPNSRKILIMLCDGQPCGYEGIERTISAVRAARKRGITVFVVSLTKGVVETNDVIYGPEWNIRAFDGSIDNALRRILLDTI